MIDPTPMKIFLDTADTELIKKYFSTGLIDGVTTNPTLIMKSGRNPEEVYKEIADIGVKDISMEVVGDSPEMTVEGRRLHSIFREVATIKVPCTYDGLLTCKELRRELIRVNVTLVFSVAQAILAAKAKATYISPFVGRVDDNSFGGVNLVKDIVSVYKQQNVHTEVLSASLRNVKDVSDCFGYGSNIVTMPPAVFVKMYNNILTDKGLELFDRDWKAVNT